MTQANFSNPGPDRTGPNECIELVGTQQSSALPQSKGRASASDSTSLPEGGTGRWICVASRRVVACRWTTNGSKKQQATTSARDLDIPWAGPGRTRRSAEDPQDRIAVLHPAWCRARADFLKIYVRFYVHSIRRRRCGRETEGNTGRDGTRSPLAPHVGRVDTAIQPSGRRLHGRRRRAPDSIRTNQGHAEKRARPHERPEGREQEEGSRTGNDGVERREVKD